MRLAELSRSIDPGLLGHRLKTARVAAGLTQAQLAGDDVTSAYVSRIEAGQRRPEATLLERFAHRVGVRLEDLLEEAASSDAEARLRVLFDHAELALVSGDAPGALTQLDAALAELAGQGGDRSPLHLRARHIRAMALEATGRTDEAIRAFEALTSEPEADIRWVRAVIALSRCYRESGDFSRAIETGEQAAELIEELGLRGTTEAIQLTVTVAGAYLERGDLTHALRICQECAEEAERVQDPVAKASAYWNASVIESMRGNVAPALDLAQRALAAFELGEDSRNLGRLRTEIALIHLLQRPPEAEAAKVALEQAERELAWSAASTVDRARHSLLLSKAEVLLGDLEQARQHALDVSHAVGDGSPMLVAEAQAVRGRILAAEGDDAAAREMYRQAVAIVSGLGVDRDVARLWFDLAGLLEEAGDAAGALDAYRRGATASGLADPHDVAARSHTQQ